MIRPNTPDGEDVGQAARAARAALPRSSNRLTSLFWMPHPSPKTMISPVLNRFAGPLLVALTAGGCCSGRPNTPLRPEMPLRVRDSQITVRLAIPTNRFETIARNAAVIPGEVEFPDPEYDTGSLSKFRRFYAGRRSYQAGNVEWEDNGRARIENGAWIPMGPTRYEDGGTRFQWIIQRDPQKLQIAFEDNSVVLRQEIDYAFRVQWRNVIASTGLGGQWPRKIDAEVGIALAPNPDWTIKAAVRVGLPYRVGYEPDLKSILGIVSVGFDKEIRDRIDASAIAGQELLRQKIEETANESLGPMATKAWDALSRPITVDNQHGISLLLHPQEVLIDKVRATTEEISLLVSVRAQPDLVFGSLDKASLILERPPLNTSVRPVDSKTTINTNVRISYESATAALKARLRDPGVDDWINLSGGPTVKIVDGEVYGNNGNVVTRLSLAGDYNGDLYVWGVPQYNEASQTFLLTDVDFSFDALRPMDGLAAWLAHAQIRDGIARLARLDLAEHIAKLKASAQVWLSRSIGDCDLVASNMDIVGLGVVARPAEISTIVRVQCDLELRILAIK